MQSSTFDIDSVKRRDYENQDDFMVRVGLLVMDGKLTWQMAADIFNEDTGKDYGECAYRKHFKSFYQGMQYQKNLSGVVENNKGVSKTCILSISDLHIPFQKPVETFKDFAGKVDVLQINGDLIDCQSISRFNKSYRVSPIEEMITARQYVIDLIELIRPKKVLVNYGNHELRLGQYLAKHLDNELQELMPETAFDYIFVDGFTHYDRKTRAKVKYPPLCEVFDDVEIEYSGTWWSQYGDVLFVHPRAFQSGPMKTAEKAMYWFRNEGVQFNTLVMSHTHRLGMYKIGNTTIYEQGCCCDTDKMLYNDGNLINSQKEGYIVIYLDWDGNLMDDKTHLVSLN